MIWYFLSQHVLLIICKYKLYFNAPVWEPPFNLYHIIYQVFRIFLLSWLYISFSQFSHIFEIIQSLFHASLTLVLSLFYPFCLSLSQIIISLSSNVWFWAWGLVWLWSRLHRPRRLALGAEWLLFFGLNLWTWGWSHLWNCFRQVHLKLYFIILITIFWLLLLR